MDELAGVEERYAEASGARSAWFIEARHVPEALGLCGLVRDAVLIACANDFSAAFGDGFPCRRIVLIDDPAPEACLAASASALDDGLPVAWFANSIGCRGLRVADIRRLSGSAREVGALLVVDNTLPSLFGCHPFEAGVPVVFEALDRVAAGRLPRRAVAVSVAPAHFKQGRRRFDNEFAVRAHRFLSNALRPPVDAAGIAAAVDEGLDTLALRMQAHMDNARVIAEYLAAHDGVEAVWYPGLSGHVDRFVASHVLVHGAGPAIDFSLPAPLDARAFADILGEGYRGCVAGGSRTRISDRDGWDARGLRLFAGTDEALRVVDDLDRALRALSRHSM